MRSVLLITGLLMAVALAFVMGVFVGVRHDGVRTDPSAVAGATKGKQTSSNIGENASTKGTDEAKGEDAKSKADAPSGKDKASSEGANRTDGGTAGNSTRRQGSATGSPSDASSAGGAGEAAAESSSNMANGDGKDAGGKQTATWLTEAVPEPADGDAVGEDAMPGGAVAAGNAGTPTVLTASESGPGAPVYAVQTRHAVPGKRAMDLVRKLSGERATAHMLPAFGGDAGTPDPDRAQRAHVRLGAFAEREAAATVAERAMRSLDVRLRVVRVRRPAGAASQAEATSGRGSPGDGSSGGS